mmetsp:Transcript_17716/g.30677  ORF Transcript_17716/g.30677 Transcript_17716/m.30677 type:complete len:251 (-) Transcript_17716:580-1332(-)
MVLIWRYPKCSPRQVCLPPPKEIKAKGPFFLSSIRGSAKRSGSYFSGSVYTLSSLCATAGDTTKMWSSGIFIPLYSTACSTWRMSRISGGYMRNVSFTQLCSFFIAIRASKFSFPSGQYSSRAVFCSSISSSKNRSFSLWIRSAVHVDVMADVCCPPNSNAISIPVISSSVRLEPFSYFAVINVLMKSSGISSPAAMRFRRASNTPLNSLTMAKRARSRLRCASMGRYGKKTLMGCMPSSKSWYSRATSA